MIDRWSMVRYLLFAFGFLAAPSFRATVDVVGAFTHDVVRLGSTKTTRLLAQTRPVIVAGSSAGSSSAGAAAAQEAALGATLALSAWDLLRDDGDGNRKVSTLPPQPVIALLASTEEKSAESSSYEAELEASLRVSGAVSSAIFVHNGDCRYPSIDQYNDVICQCSVDPVLHVIMEGAAAAQPLLSPSIASKVAFLGLEPIVSEQARRMGVVLPEVAQRCGSMLQEIVEAFVGQASSPSMAITLDLPLHLSMLQANSLPKSRSVHEDSFLCRDTQNAGTFILVDYQYDYGNPFGGTDPLSCPTREITISPAGDVITPAEGGTNIDNGSTGFASAAAYTALRGNGVPAFAAACIASSVGTVMDKSLLHFSVVERIAKLAEEAKRAAVEQPILRKKYIDFGYK